jgi:hypothetical protein
MHGVGAVHGRANPAGELVTVPNPAPLNVTVRAGFVAPPFPEKQITFPVIDPVTTAPDEEIPPALLFVFKVAFTRVLPQVAPVAVKRPAALIVIIWVAVDDHVT